MRVLWLSINSSLYSNAHKAHNGGGWVASLENIIKAKPNIQLGVAFEFNSEKFKENIDGVIYYPISKRQTRWNHIKDEFTISHEEKLIIPECVKIIEDFKPDIIQCFGSEWCYGLVAEFTIIPVVIHIQGSMPSYFNALYPPGYNKWSQIFHEILSPKNLVRSLFSEKKSKQRTEREFRILKKNHFYLGRTEWDKAIVDILSPQNNYYICNEALRDSFYNSNQHWELKTRKKYIICTTGNGSLWKGIDVILKTANILKQNSNIDFEWRLVGGINNLKYIEKQEQLKFNSTNIKALGILNESDLKSELLDSDIYVHPAYIDNSPNSLCEAQILGVPCIATYVGGIPTIIKNGVEGMLVPSNDPYFLAQKIVELLQNKKMQKSFSEMSMKRSQERHNPEIIFKQLINAYDNILQHRK